MVKGAFYSQFIEQKEKQLNRTSILKNSYTLEQKGSTAQYIFLKGKNYEQKVQRKEIKNVS